MVCYLVRIALSLGLSCRRMEECEIVDGMRKGVVASIGIIALIAALLMLQLTTPHMVGPLGVLAFFVLIYIASACATYLALLFGVKLVGRFATKGKWLARIESVSHKKLYYYGSFIALAPVILLGMRSVGFVRATDILLLVIFQVIGCFYISRRF